MWKHTTDSNQEFVQIANTSHASLVHGREVQVSEYIQLTTLYRPDKDKWINKERLRWAKYFNVPVVETVPDGFPANTLHVMRSICAVGQLAGNDQSQQATVRVLDVLFDAYWIKSRDITDKSVVAEVLTSAGCEDLGRVSELAAGEAKKILMGNTDRAFADGAFGLPWFACENDRGEKEGFWGVDHLGAVLDFLGLDKPAGRGGWKAML